MTKYSACYEGKDAYDYSIETCIESENLTD